jgi:hypothetical protein
MQVRVKCLYDTKIKVRFWDVYVLRREQSFQHLGGLPGGQPAPQVPILSHADLGVTELIAIRVPSGAVKNGQCRSAESSRCRGKPPCAPARRALPSWQWSP